MVSRLSLSDKITETIIGKVTWLGFTEPALGDKETKDALWEN
jgi:hypothetical protein